LQELHGSMAACVYGITAAGKRDGLYCASFVVHVFQRAVMFPLPSAIKLPTREMLPPIKSLPPWKSVLAFRLLVEKLPLEARRNTVLRAGRHERDDATAAKESRASQDTSPLRVGLRAAGGRAPA